MGYFGSYFGGGSSVTGAVASSSRLYLTLYTDLGSQTATQGDTVYLGVIFKDKPGSDGVPTDPDSGSVVLKTYDGQGKVIDALLPVPEAEYRIGVGTFEYPYPTPAKNPITFEYSGTAAGKVELGRASLPTKFV